MIPFHRPYFNHLELLASLQSGAARDKFEAAMAARAGAAYGVAFSYGRVGFMAALKALEIPEGEIILPAYTCLVIAHALVASANRPVFVDIDLADYNMNISALSRALSSQTRAVIATHMYGYPSDIDAIRAVVDNKKILIVEDAALSPLPAGGLRGDLGLFSFGFAKPISTIEGGMILCNSGDFYERIRAYRDKNFNQLSYKSLIKRWIRLLAGYFVFRPLTYGLWYRYQVQKRPEFTGDPRPEFQLPADYLPLDSPTAYSDFQARIGLAQLNKLDSMLAKRYALAQLYDQGLRDLPGLHPAPIVDRAAYSHYTIRVPERDQINFRARMARCGVAVDQAFDYALPQLKRFQSFAQGIYPQAVQAAREVVNLPCYPDLSIAQVQRIIVCARQCLPHNPRKF